MRPNFEYFSIVKVWLLNDSDFKCWDKAMPKMTQTPFQGSHMFTMNVSLQGTRSKVN